MADGALFAGVAVWFFTGGGNTPIAVAAVVCLVLGMVVSYARAKAESLGFTANTGIAERAERLVSVLVVTGFTGLGLPAVVLLVTLRPARCGQPGDSRPAGGFGPPAGLRRTLTRRLTHRTIKPAGGGGTSIRTARSMDPAIRCVYPASACRLHTRRRSSIYP